MSEHRLHWAPSQALAPKAERRPAPNRAVVDSAVLLQGQQEVTITHLGQQYRLRVTALGKLILTK